MAQLNWTPRAKSDLVSIAEFIAEDSKKYARIQIKRIRQRAQYACEFPLSGRVVPEFGQKDIREFILGNYRIIYRLVEKDRIDILAVHHSSRNLIL